MWLPRTSAPHHNFDLQIQSTASDGRHTPAEIVAMAQELGLSVIALTDHDTTAGVDEAVAAGATRSVRVIPGIEISVEEHGAHILGFGIDHGNTHLRDALEKAARDRLEGARQMLENLRAEGFAADWEDVMREATGAVVARPHIARAILSRPENAARLGGAATVHDFIDRFLSNDSPHYVRRARIGATDAIALIHGAGGVAVWSHPALHFRGDPEGLENFLREMAARGLDGVEAFNPSQTEDDAELLQSLAAQYHLLVTAGSDFHERGAHPADPASGMHAARTLGDYETYGFDTGDIVARLDEAIRLRRAGAAH
jgi:predicted metal-dependent phosphoesterase TrpH